MATGPSPTISSVNRRPILIGRVEDCEEELLVADLQTADGNKVRGIRDVSTCWSGLGGQKGVDHEVGDDSAPHVLDTMHAAGDTLSSRLGDVDDSVDEGKNTTLEFSNTPVDPTALA